jgi:hypothetical protein
MPAPNDYSSGFAAVANPAQTFMQGLQMGNGIQQMDVQRQQQELALEQQKQQAQVLHNLLNKPNPTAQDYADATVAIPSLSAQFKQAHEMRNEAQQQADLQHSGQIFAALSNGQPGVASQLARDRATALRNSGQEAAAKQAELGADMIDAHPDFARTLAGMKLSSTPGGDKVISSFASAQKMPDELRQTKADADLKVTQARNEPTKLSLDLKNVQSQIDDRAKRYALDADKLTTDTQIKLQEMGQKFGEVPEYVSKEVTAAATDSIASDQSATRMLDLADKLEQAAPELGSGLTAKTSEWWKRVYGSQDELTRIRGDYARIVTPSAMSAYKKVASGSTSDKDIETAMTGVPSETADPATMASYLRGMAKLQVYDSVLSNARAEWFGSVRSLGKASKDIEVDGVKVPSGMTFKQFTDVYVPKKVAEQLGTKQTQQIQSRGYMKHAAPSGATGSY